MSDSDFSDDVNTPTEADLDTYYGSKYLSALEIGDRKIRTKIAKVRKAALQQQGGLKAAVIRARMRGQHEQVMTMAKPATELDSLRLIEGDSLVQENVDEPMQTQNPVKWLATLREWVPGEPLEVLVALINSLIEACGPARVQGLDALIAHNRRNHPFRA
jgi:hypothetical protein